MNLQKLHLPNMEVRFSPIINVSYSAIEEYAFYGEKRISVLKDLYSKVDGFIQRPIKKCSLREIEVVLFKVSLSDQSFFNTDIS